MSPTTDLAPKEGYLSIFRSTLLIGGGSVINMAIGLVRTKGVAVILGPSGIALYGILNQITEVVSAAFSLGLGTSGVRQIAASNAAGDSARVSRIVQTLKRTTWITGLAAGACLVLLAVPITRLTFGEQGLVYRWAVALLALAVLFRALTTGQGCLVAGTRRVGIYLRISLVGSVASVLIAIPCVMLMGMGGVVWSVVGISLSGLVATWWLSRPVRVESTPCSASDSLSESRLLVVLGVPIMLAGVAGTIGPYFERVILLRHLGLEMMGQYQAAIGLAAVSATFVTSAMSADYYPKLVALAEKPADFDHEMNAQIEVALLLSAPLVVALAAFAEVWMRMFYSSEFIPGIDVLVVATIGIIGRVLSAPLRLALLAKHKGKTFLLIEVATTATGLAMIAALAPRLGLLGCAIAFSALSLSVALGTAFLFPLISGQKVSAANKVRAIVAILLLVLCSTAHFVAGGHWSKHLLVGAVLCATSFYSFTSLAMAIRKEK